MKTFKFKYLFIFSFLVFMFLSLNSLEVDAIKQEGHIKLLAVSEIDGNVSGTIADLFVEIKPGKGRVFIQTFPLTKIDTQISMKLAKEITCNMLEFDCNKYDFYYMISSDSPIIGGPSAGAAAALLTAAMLKDLEIKHDISITGTINSAGLIGKVSGLKEKILAASQAGIKQVLIPYGSSLIKEDNKTLDLIEYGRKIGVDVKEVIDLKKALEIATGFKLKKFNKTLNVDKNYLNIMKNISIALCSNITEKNEKIKNLTIKARKAFLNNNYYSASSYCFGARVELNKLNFKDIDKKLKINQLLEEIKKLRREIKSFELNSLVNIQTYMLVMTRLDEAEEILNKENITIDDLAYVDVRIYSAKLWSYFFNVSSEPSRIDPQAIENACFSKLAQAEERYQYLFIYFPFQEIRDKINSASEYARNKDYFICLYKASIAIADADIILSTLNADEHTLSKILEIKLKAAKEEITKAIAKGYFPLAAYSYFEYSKDLAKYNETASALLYSEYALELSDILVFSINQQGSKYYISSNKLILQLGCLIIFLIGITIGFLLGKWK